MKAHLRASLWLLVLTVLITAVIYPAVVLGIGQILFHEKAEGSLLTDSQGKTVGSRLIAQPFTDARYFHPRPSAVSYNAAATGGSNWSASNPALRKRVLKDLGLLLKYRNGQPIGPDIEGWVRESLRKNPKILSQWQQESPDLPGWWVAADSANTEFVTKWAADHPDDIARWRKTAAQGAEPTPADQASLFFASFADKTSPTWPETTGKDLQSAFFQVWWKDHANADVEPVPADLVMASGCGVDPDITVKGALYQLDRVAAAWAQEQKRDEAATRDTIKKLIESLAYAPLGGLVGQPMVNVLELNVAVRDAMQSANATAQ
jgi:K+-transporting ATPase ATPase C chain